MVAHQHGLAEHPKNAVLRVAELLHFLGLAHDDLSGIRYIALAFSRDVYVVTAREGVHLSGEGVGDVLEHLLFEQVGVLAFHVPVVLAEEVVEGSGGVGRVVLGYVELVHVLAFTFDARLFGVLLSEILSPFEDLFRVPFVDHAAGDIGILQRGVEAEGRGFEDFLLDVLFDVRVHVEDTLVFLGRLTPRLHILGQLGVFHGEQGGGGLVLGYTPVQQFHVGVGDARLDTGKVGGKLSQSGPGVMVIADLSVAGVAERTEPLGVDGGGQGSVPAYIFFDGFGFAFPCGAHDHFTPSRLFLAVQ